LPPGSGPDPLGADLARRAGIASGARRTQPGGWTVASVIAPGPAASVLRAGIVAIAGMSPLLKVVRQVPRSRGHPL